MLRARLQQALKEAINRDDSCATATLRLIITALKDRDVAACGIGTDVRIDDDAVTVMLRSMVQLRRGSIALYEKSGRLGLAKREQEEVDVIARFLPEPMAEHAIEEAIIKAIDSINASGLKDMGRVMDVLHGDYAGRMDLRRASALVKARLSQ